jgi:Tfp pilus assembly protein PilO
MIEFIQNNQLVIFATLAGILLILAIYLGYLVSQLKKRKEYQQTQMLKVQQVLKDKKGEVIESIRIICLATIQDQCEVSEAVIRLEKVVGVCSRSERKG